MIVLLARGVLPTLLTRRAASRKVISAYSGRSRMDLSAGQTRLGLQWQVIELWTLAAERFAWRLPMWV